MSIKWNSVKKSLPKDRQLVLAFDGEGYEFLRYNSDLGTIEGMEWEVFEATHWTELNKPTASEGV